MNGIRIQSIKERMANIMTDRDMHLELKENKVEDNPFDVILHHSIELTRELLFACHRLKNPEIPEHICINEESLGSHIDNIREEFSKLLSMSNETVTMCRETSYYYQQDKFDKMNESLLEFERNMETAWSRCVPNRNDRFEQIRLGKESKEYKRLLELRKIISESEELSSVDDKYLHSLCDVISRSDECVQHWMAKEEFEKKQEIIQKYGLSEDDINYMISYRNSEK